MANHMDTMEVWEPSPKQAYAAVLLAQMHTWQETSDQVGCDIATISRWLNIPEFRALVEANVRAVLESLDNQLNEAHMEGLKLWIKMIRGEVSARDKRLSWIAPSVRKLLDASIVFDDPSRSNARAIPGMAVQFNIGGNESRQLAPPTDVTPD